MNCIVVFLSLLFVFASFDAGASNGLSANRLLVKFMPEVTVMDSSSGRALTPSVESMLRDMGIRYWRRVLTSTKPEPITGLDRWFLIQTESGADVESIAADFRSLPFVENAEPEYLTFPCDVPNDPKYNAQFHWALMHADLAWDVTHGSPDVIVAVIDSGSDFGHEDLTTSFWLNDDPVNGTDDDSNGFIDDFHGWDFRNNDNDPDNINDDNLHGTHVAGIIGAVTNNALGVAGGTWGCPVMTCKVFPDEEGGGAWPADVVDAIYYAVENGASVINMSLGNESGAAIEEDACWYAYQQGVVVMAAAGNGGDDGIGDSSPHYPASYPGVMAVGSTTQLDIKDGSSNYGDWVDVYAPGAGVISTEPANTYKKESGTSMASPVAASLAALILSEYPTLTPDEVEVRLEGGCININLQNPAFWNELNPGRIDFFNSITNGPVIRLDHVVVQDPSGNDNHEADSGETVQLDLYLINHSWTGGQDVTVQATIVGSGGSIVDGSAAYGDFESKQIKKNLDPLTLSISASAGSEIQLNLAYSGSGYVSSETLDLSLNNPYPQMPGFPMETLGGFNSSPKVADLDNDGVNEIIVVSNNGLLYLLNQDGSSKSGFPINNSEKQASDRIIAIGAPAIGDLDLDGDFEIVAADYWSDTEYKNPSNPSAGQKHREVGRIFAYHHNGAAVNGFPKVFETEFVDVAIPPLSTAFKCSPVLADVTGDSHLEIITSNYDNKVYVFAFDGAVVTGWPYDVGTDVFATAAVHDLDGDGSQEIVIASKDDTEPYDSGAIYVLNGAGSVKPGFPVNINNQIYSAPVLVDLDHDSDLEIVFGYGDINNTLPARGVFALHHDGTIASGFPYSTTSTVYGSPAIGDIDEDGESEIVVADFSAKVYAIHFDGTSLPNWPVQTSTNPDPDLASISSSPMIADLDGAGGPEIIVGCADSNLYIVHNNGAFMTHTPLILDADGFASPCITDIDKDNDIEILMNAKSCYVYNLSGEFNPARQFWTTFHGDNQNTGYAPSIAVDGVNLTLNDLDLIAGDHFKLDCILTNTSSTAMSNVDLFVLLDVYNQYWFYPSWQQTAEWFDLPTLAPGTAILNILAFDWPTGDLGSAEDLRFWAAILTSEGQLFGTYDMVSFGYH